MKNEKNLDSGSRSKEEEMIALENGLQESSGLGAGALNIIWQLYSFFLVSFLSIMAT